jgi:signal transduction histidine kinase
MSTSTTDFTPRERELGAIIGAYNSVTEQLKQSHERLRGEVERMREELVRKNRQLRRRERLAALGEMAAGVAHEIRNPLGGIQMFASLLRRDLADRPDSLRLVERIIQGVGSLESIVTDILEFSRPMEPQPARVNLGMLAREVIELAAARSGDGAVPIEIEDGAAEVELITDGRLLQRAVLNLVFNAVDATAAAKRGGKVTIHGRSGRREQVLISVSDEGAGIPAEMMDRIFNPFFTTKSNGTGLGLAIVHQTVETLGGTIQAANRQGGGATFTLTLPRVLDVESGAGSESAKTAVPMPTACGSQGM